MTNAPVRIVVLLGALSLIGIIATQVYLVNRAVTSQEQQFNHSVLMALRNVVESVCEVTGVDVPTSDPIDQVSSNYFIVRTNNKIDLEALEYHLTAELEKRQITQSFEYGVYDCQRESMVYGNFVSLSANQSTPKMSNLPELDDYDYYFGVYFPGKTAGLLWGIDWWKYTSALTILITIFFTYAVFVILRQKRLSAIQRDFINNITHEFKTPLSTLKVASSVLSEGTDERMSRYARLIETETSRLERHVDQLLKSAVLEHKPGPSLAPIDLKGFLNEVIGKLDFGKKRLIMEIDEQVSVMADPYLLETAVFNLVENALKYGGERITISIFREGRVGVITVQDSGPGIPKGHEKKIFDKFYRISQGDLHDVKGFGLGLYVVKNALKKMKGRIKLLEENRSTFKIELPMT